MADSFVKDANYFVTSLASVFTLFSAWRTAKLSYYIHDKKRTIKKIQKSDVVTVDQLKSRGMKVNQVVILRGKVGTQDGKEVERNLGWGKKEKLAVSLKFTEAIYSNDSFDQKKNNYILNMKEALKSCTIEGSTKISLYSQGTNNQRETILLRHFDQKDYSRVLQILSWEEKKRDLTLVEHINILLLGVLRALVMIGSEGKEGGYIRGLQIGKRDIEAGLKVGASISALGTISLTIDGEFVLDAERIFKDRLSQIAGLKEQVDTLITKRNMWLLGTVLGVVYLGRRAFKYCRQKNIKIPFIDQMFPGK